MKVNPVLFWKKVNKTDTCWLWNGEVHISGYGLFFAENRSWRAHRISYLLVKGEIPDGLQIDHLCRVRNCVNPDHLEAVTNAVNILRGTAPPADNAKKTRCQYGHEFSGKNKKGHRICHKCKSRWQMEYKKRTKEPNFVPRRTWTQGPYRYMVIK